MIQTAHSAFEAAHFERANRRQAHIERLENGITELSAHIYAATYRLLELIREYDECEGWVQPGLRSCAHWLNWKCGISIGAAREKVRVAHALKDLSKISEAFREGRLSYSKVRAMTRVGTPENEDYLLMIARHGTAAHVDRLVGLYRQVKRSEALALENRRHELRELSLYQVDNDCFVIRGRLTPEHADGEPLSVGRKTRTIPPAIRRALKRRDGGCRFPGCTCTRFVDAHHIRHWADGGETSMDDQPAVGGLLYRE